MLENCVNDYLGKLCTEHPEIGMSHASSIALAVAPMVELTESQQEHCFVYIPAPCLLAFRLVHAQRGVLSCVVMTSPSALHWIVH